MWINNAYISIDYVVSINSFIEPLHNSSGPGLDTHLCLIFGMSNVDTGNEIFDLNPYEGHPALSTLEADVLWEYAKLSQHVKIVEWYSFFQLVGNVNWDSFMPVACLENTPIERCSR